MTAISNVTPAPHKSGRTNDFVTKVLLIIHVVAAILAIGPVAVAASMFPPATRRARAHPDEPTATGTVRVLHRICRVYAIAGLAVPVFGLGTASAMKVLGDAWVLVSIGLTVVAAAVLITLVLPAQDAAVTALDAGGGGDSTVARSPAPTTGQLAMFAGLFNILWVAVTVLMILRPGSTTGV
jgi:uncharacterized membrane protein